MSKEAASNPTGKNLEKRDQFLYFIELYMGKLQLDVFEAKASQLRAADWFGMTFTMQKNGVPGEIVGHARSGALHACPVMGLAELCLLLLKHGAPHDGSLGT